MGYKASIVTPCAMPSGFLRYFGNLFPSSGKLLEVSGKFVRRVTAGGTAVKDGRAKVCGLYGNTIAWNQLANSTPYSGLPYTSGGVTISQKSAGVYEVVVTTSPSARVRTQVTTAITGVSQGTYMILGSLDSFVRVYDSYIGGFANDIRSQAFDRTNPEIIVEPNCPVGTYIVTPQIFNLTQMFGTDAQICTALGVANLSTSVNKATAIANFRKMFPADYYAHSAGELLSFTSFPKGWNIWDEEWELGSISTIDGSKVSDIGTSIRTKNFVPVTGGTTYYMVGVGLTGYGRLCWYDSNKAFISFDPVGANTFTQTAPANACYLMYSINVYPTTAYDPVHNGICISLSNASYNGLYVPHEGSRIVSTGFNVWDEEWEVSGDHIVSKNFVPVTGDVMYYLKSPYAVQFTWYDEGKNVIGANGINANSKMASMPSNCAYLKFAGISSYGTTYNHDICINVSDEALNGQYKPYMRSECRLPVASGNSPLVLRSAGAVHDEVKGDKVIRNVAERAYQSGDESDSSVITDGTHTNYALATPTEEAIPAWSPYYQIENGGSEELAPANEAQALTAAIYANIGYPKIAGYDYTTIASPAPTLISAIDDGERPSLRPEIIDLGDLAPIDDDLAPVDDLADIPLGDIATADEVDVAEAIPADDDEA